jgi:hypothetical protein
MEYWKNGILEEGLGTEIDCVRLGKWGDEKNK